MLGKIFLFLFGIVLIVVGAFIIFIVNVPYHPDDYDSYVDFERANGIKSIQSAAPGTHVYGYSLSPQVDREEPLKPNPAINPFRNND